MDTVNGQLAVASLFIAFVLCYIFIYLKGKTRKQRFAEKAKAAGCIVQGNRVHMRELCWYEHGATHNRQVTRIATYSYEVDGIHYRKKLSCFSQHDTEPSPPQVIRIYYSAANPKKSVGSTEISRINQLQAGCLPTIVIPILVFYIVNYVAGLLV